MLANYGYEDGSGIYYITIDTDKCNHCEEKSCIKACQAELFKSEVDDWDNEIVVIDKSRCNMLLTACAVCKSTSNPGEQFLCQAICRLKAIDHTW